MIKKKGFTSVELMIVIVMIILLSMVVVNVIMGVTSTNKVSYGINGLTEMRCIDGYKFIIGQEGHTRQVMDELGKGVKCQ